VARTRNHRYGSGKNTIASTIVISNNTKHHTFNCTATSLPGSSGRLSINRCSMVAIWYNGAHELNHLHAIAHSRESARQARGTRANEEWRVKQTSGKSANGVRCRVVLQYCATELPCALCRALIDVIFSARARLSSHSQPIERPFSLSLAPYLALPLSLPISLPISCHISCHISLWFFFCITRS